MPPTRRGTRACTSCCQKLPRASGRSSQQQARLRPASCSSSSARVAAARRAEWAALEAKLRGGSGDAGDVVSLLERADAAHDVDVANYFHLQELRAMALVEKSLGARVSIRFDAFE